MKKIITTISVLVMCVAMLTGCGKADPVQEDLINYINKQVPTLVEVENKVTTQYAAITGTNFVDDATLTNKLKDVIIPASTELLTKTKAIVPATEEVRKVHSKYLAVVTEQHEAFNMLLQAAQKHDEKLVETVNGKLSNAEKVSNEYLVELEALKKAHKVESSK